MRVLSVAALVLGVAYACSPTALPVSVVAHIERAQYDSDCEADERQQRIALNAMTVASSQERPGGKWTLPIFKRAA
jgi:hypothetical protein